MEHVTYPHPGASLQHVPTSMQTQQRVNHHDGNFISVEVERLPERDQQDTFIYNRDPHTTSGGLVSENIAQQGASNQRGYDGMRSIDPTPGSSHTGIYGGPTSNIQITGSSKQDERSDGTENTLQCSNESGPSNVPLLTGKSLQAHFYSNKCRVCLEKGNIPIYGSASGIGEAISLIADVDIVNEKNFPRHLCAKCYSLLQGAMKFRKMAQQTDKILKQSSCVSSSSKSKSKSRLEDDDYYLGVNFQHDSGSKLEAPALALEEPYRVEHTESQQAFDFRQAYQMLISQSSSGKKHKDDNYEAENIKTEPIMSNKEDKSYKLSKKRSLDDDDDYDDFFDSEPSREQPQQKTKKGKRDIFKDSISFFLKTEMVESPVHVQYQEPSRQGMIMNLIKCEVCNKEFAKIHYKKHLAAHGMIQCKICKNAYLKINYRKHMREAHRKIFKYVCEICGKELRSKSSHHLHKLTHSNEFPFKCEICPYRGRHADLLKTHMRSHTKDYKYLCTECPTRCLTSSHLNRHLRTHKEGHFKCETCEKAFHTVGSLQKHQQVDHLGIKNHICNLCGKAFGCRKIMMKHQRQVHKRQKGKGGRMPSYLEAEKQQDVTDYN